MRFPGCRDFTSCASWGAVTMIASKRRRAHFVRRRKRNWRKPASPLNPGVGVVEIAVSPHHGNPVEEPRQAGRDLARQLEHPKDVALPKGLSVNNGASRRRRASGGARGEFPRISAP